MRPFKLFVLYFSIFFLTNSCSKISEITIDDVSNISLKGFEGNSLLVSANIIINNPTQFKVIMIRTDTKVFVDGTYVGKLLYDQPIVIPRKTRNSYNLVFKIRLTNILGTTFAMMNLKGGKKVNLRIEGEITGRFLLIRKKIEINETREVAI